ncbi:hypothetical protein LCGC14_1139430 [marine sediment metagenome]|uniref:Uncharacterized protein n=1 Tax=marine sediment metagenome TaxID=412755 RepID=A0A0F9MLR0_9ZZZZ
MSDIQESGFGRATDDVTIVTTIEVVAVTSEKIKVTRPTMRALILAWMTVASGTGTTSLTVRIRSGDDASGTLRSEAVDHDTTAGEIHTWMVAAEEDVSGVDEVQYSATVRQTGASANGTVGDATILVFLF